MCRPCVSNPSKGGGFNEGELSPTVTVVMHSNRPDRDTSYRVKFFTGFDSSLPHSSHRQDRKRM